MLGVEKKIVKITYANRADLETEGVSHSLPRVFDERILDVRSGMGLERISDGFFDDPSFSRIGINLRQIFFFRSRHLSFHLSNGSGRSSTTLDPFGIKLWIYSKGKGIYLHRTKLGFSKLGSIWLEHIEIWNVSIDLRNRTNKEKKRKKAKKEEKEYTFSAIWNHHLNFEKDKFI